MSTMFSGFYTIASGMFTQQRSLNAIANNVSNAKTPGYKEDHVVTSTFEEMLMNRMENGAYTPIGKQDMVRSVYDVPSSFAPAPLEDTARDLDLALDGEGFFNIMNAEGEVYLTRNGKFDLDAEGYLVLAGSGRVQGTDGDIMIGASDFGVTKQGTLYDAQGKMLGQLTLSTPAPGTTLTKAPNGMYRIDPNPPLTPEELQLQASGTVLPARPEPTLVPSVGVTVRQGMLETSNVDYNRSVSLMMEIQRNFQSCSKVLQAIDTLNRKTTSIASL